MSRARLTATLWGDNGKAHSGCHDGRLPSFVGFIWQIVIARTLCRAVGTAHRTSSCARTHLGVRGQRESDCLEYRRPDHLHSATKGGAMIRNLLHGVGVAATVFALFSQTAHASIYTLSGALDAAQVVDPLGGPTSTSTATGFGVVTIDTSLFTITTDLSWSGLTGPADRAHLHDAPAGVSRTTDDNDNFFHEVLYTSWPSDPQGPTVACAYAGICVPATGSSYDVLQLSANDGYAVSAMGPGAGFPDFASLVAAFLANGVYVDIHTEAWPDGGDQGAIVSQHRHPTPSRSATLRHRPRRDGSVRLAQEPKGRNRIVQ